MSESSQPSKAVLLVNLGTTEAPTAPAVRSFLREFLSDRRVVDVPRFIWYPILYGLILPFRPSKAIPRYNRIWIKKGSGIVINGKCEGSPLTLYSESLTEQVRAMVEKQSGGDVVVRLAMRYGANNIPTTLAKLHEEFPSVRELVVLPLFPQYSSTSSACIYDEVFRFYTDKNRRCVPGIRTIRDYAEHPAYITAIATTLLDAMHRHLAATNQGAATADSRKSALVQLLKETAVLISYHSIPIRYAEGGDDYPQRCEATTRAIQAHLLRETGVDFTESIVHAYQSQMGNQPWIGPKAADAATTLPLPPGDARKQAFSEACHNTAIAAKQAKVCFAISPGFAVDCVETVHDLEDEACRLFKENGGSTFVYVPCLNDSAAQVKTIAAVLNFA
uniref:Ferrochelatase n=1 Tax=Crithidia acanthocephali TaxID=59798 RepID=G1C9Q5_9TRYP|nr:ferrochelatase [Crithidia acanthocephali]